MKKSWVQRVLVLAIPFAAVNCVQEKLDLRHEQGNEVVFGAATEYRNGESTRTAYSGEFAVDGGTEYERIDWVTANDRIRIVCAQASWAPDQSSTASDYTFTGNPVTVGRKSQAGIQPANKNGIRWGTGMHHFFALYPASGMQSEYGKTVAAADAAIVVDGDEHAKLSGVVKASQPYAAYKTYTKGGVSYKEYKPDMNASYMFAVASAEAGSTSGPVALPFQPLVTAFEITLKAGDTEAVGMKLKKVELVSEDGTTGSDLTGKFTATIASDGTYALSVTNKGRKITVPVTATDQQALTTGDAIKLTLFALPTDQTGMTLVFTFDKSGSEVQRKLPLRADNNDDGIVGSDEWITVAAGKKVYISNLGIPGNVWHYTIEGVEGDEIVINGIAGGSNSGTIKSYRTSGSTTEYVPVKFEYSADGTTYASGLPAGLENFVMSAGSQAIEKTVTATVGSHEEIAKITQKNEIIEHARIMATRASVSGYDLSMHTVTGESRSNPVTANSYVVTAPGTYRFPIVYGNAIDYNKKADVRATTAGGGNVNAYRPSGTASNTFLTPFQRFDGNGITMPSILNDLGLSYSDVEPVVVWQDVPAGQEIITETPTIQSASGSWALPIGYICFKIDPTVINETAQTVKGARQGNIVIALRTKAAKTIAGNSWPKGTILWSWHIWVTDRDMTPVPLKTKGTTIKTYNNVMPLHLGWCDEKVFNVTHYKDRIWYVKATQVVDTDEAESTVFRVVQYGEKTYEQIAFSSAVCYQWGRKDPFLPGYNKYRDTWYHELTPEIINPVNKPWSSPSGYNIIGTQEGYIAVSEEAYSIAECIRNPHIFNVRGIYNYNLWNAAQKELGEDIAVVKTAYDPCPPGYSLPHRYAWSNFNTKGTDAEIGYQVIEEVNAIDSDGDGVLTSADYEIDNGWHFRTGYGDGTIFMPQSLGRVGRQSYGRYYDACYLWTSSRTDYPEAANGGFDMVYGSEFAEPWVSDTAHGLTVHPVAE